MFLGMQGREVECSQEEEDFHRDRREDFHKDRQEDFHRDRQEDFHRDRREDFNRDHNQDFHKGDFHRGEDFSREEEEDRPDHRQSGGFHLLRGPQVRPGVSLTGNIFGPLLDGPVLQP